nr:hypothetical protein [Tanacetum cinerariifolium]
MTLIEAARTMMADSLLPIQFWAEEPEFDEKKPESKVNVSPSSSAQSKKLDDKTKKEAKGKSPVESLIGNRNLSAEFEDLSDNSINEVNDADTLVPTLGQLSPNSTNTFSTDEGLGLSRFFVWKKSYWYQIDVKSAFMYGNIEEEVYVYQPPGFKDPDYSDKVYKVVKALHGLNQAPRAWYKTLSNYLLKDDDIIFGSTNKDLCKAFEKLMKDKFQMSSIGELTFFLGLKVKQKKDGIFISQDKYVAEILRKFRLTDGKSASTPIDTKKPLLKDPDVKKIFRYLKGKPHLGLWYPKDSPFDLVAYSNSDYAYASLDRKSTTEGCQFRRCRLISWQCKKQIVVATSSTEAEYVAAASCCFWTTVVVKKVNDVTRLQALVDKKKVVVTEATIRDALHLDDVEGVECLPNEEIFAELARTGYEKPSTKLTFYKAFFSSHSSMASAVICLSTGKGFSRVEKSLFEGMLVAQEVSKGDVDEVHVEYVNDAGVVTEGVASAANDVNAADEEPSIPSPTPPTPPPKPSHDIPSTSQIAQALEITKLKQRVKKLEKRNKLKVLKLRRLKRVGSAQRIDTSDDTVIDDVSKQGGIIANIDADEDVVLEDAKEVDVDAKHDQDVDINENADIQRRTAESQAEIYKIDMDHDNKVLSMQEEESEPAKLQKVVEVVTTAKIITEVISDASDTITAVSTTISAADVLIPAATTAAAPTISDTPSRKTKGVVIRDLEESTTTSTIIHSEAKSKDKGKRILVEKPKPLKKQTQIEQDEKYARELEAELNRTIDWDEVIDHVNKKAKEDNAVKRYQAMKRKPHTEAQARKNMMIHLKNVVGFKMDYFKGMSYDDIRPVFEKYFDSNVAFLQKTKEQLDEEDSRALKRLNESQEEKAAKKQKLDEEVEKLKRHLQIVPNEEDDVYT